MEAKIIIFLAFTSVALIFNALGIVLAYKVFSRATVTVTETVQELKLSENALVWLTTLAEASSNMVSVTESLKNQLVHTDPALAGAHAKYGFKLAEIDVQIERSIGKVLRMLEKVQNSIVRPANRVGATLSGIREVLSLFVDDQNDDDATPRQTK
jgi:hypothetical protein